MFRNSLRLFTILISVSLALAGSFAPAAHRLSQRGQQDSRSQGKQATPLWPASRFTETDRARALSRGLRYIYRVALSPRNVANHGTDYLWCFYTLSAAVRDENLKLMAHRMGVERADHWRRLHRRLPGHADADTIYDYVCGSEAADDLGVPDERLKEQIRRAAPRYSARDYLLFDPVTEPPPADVPADCAYDGAANPRGAKFCHVCKRRLKMRSRYDVWCDALIVTYSGDHYGVELGAHYADVLKWLPAMHPYRGSETETNPEFFETANAVTHIIYTLNNYTQYRLSPMLLPQEYQFLKRNMRKALAEDQADFVGEFMDTLRAFGLTSNDPEIRAGMEYYLKHQNRDGSWGDKDLRNRFHPTWVGISGLSEYSWLHGEGLSFPELRPLLERGNR